MSELPRRRVLVYTSTLLPTTQRFILDQAIGLSRWDVRMAGRTVAVRGLDVAHLAAVPDQLPLGRTREAIQKTTRRVPALAAAVSTTDPDLLHAHFLTAGFDVLGTLRPVDRPLVVTAHGFDATWSLWRRARPRAEVALHSLLRRRLLASPAWFVAVSTYIAERLLQLGARPDRVLVHHTGVDIGQIVARPHANGNGILYVGRLVEKKGIFDLLSAAELLARTGRPQHIRVMGDGPLRADAERVASRAGLEIDFCGLRPHEEILEAMASAAVLCAPSRTARDGDAEGFGMVLAEAQASGTPVVATRCGGMVDAVDHGRTGLLVPEASPAALAEALGSLLADEDRRQAFGDAGAKFARERFDLRKQNRRLEDIYDHVCETG